MKEPLELEAFAKLARVEETELEEYRDRGLLDPDGDGCFDEFDVLRLRLLLHYRDLGYTLDEIDQAIGSGARGALYADLLFDLTSQRIDVDEVAERIGMPVDQVVALRRAIGLEVGVIPEKDIGFYQGIKSLVETGVPFEAVLDVARVYGDTLRRLAQAEVRMFRYFVDEPLQDSVSDAERSRRIEALQMMLEPLLDPLVQHLHRQHLLRASVEEAVSALSSDGTLSTPGSLEATIAFVDLASFTPLAEVHGDEVAADVLERFDRLVRELVAEHNGSLVKQIGDAFMLTFTDPVDAVRFAVALDEAASVEAHFPALRVGINAGRVLYRVGDYVGNTVNVTSRIAALATAGEILVTKPVAEAAAEADLPIEPAGEHKLRGVSEPLMLWRIARSGVRATRRERDPVCGMIVTGEPAARLLHGGFEFVFCSDDCLNRFLERPTYYVQGAEE
jgi:adenylate cyclase